MAAVRPTSRAPYSRVQAGQAGHPGAVALQPDRTWICRAPGRRMICGREEGAHGTTQRKAPRPCPFGAAQS